MKSPSPKKQLQKQNRMVATRGMTANSLQRAYNSNPEGLNSPTENSVMER